MLRRKHLLRGSAVLPYCVLPPVHIGQDLVYSGITKLTNENNKNEAYVDSHFFVDFVVFSSISSFSSMKFADFVDFLSSISSFLSFFLSVDFVDAKSSTEKCLAHSSKLGVNSWHCSLAVLSSPPNPLPNFLFSVLLYPPKDLLWRISRVFSSPRLHLLVCLCPRCAFRCTPTSLPTLCVYFVTSFPASLVSSI